ncbi:DUF2497 domain-containing protein [Altererythrobacter sp. ZODW24]|uniref:DUF2497 domain-containing protein n=1 Tax=Altererythrobacter sp. ZODW24 TaxID=2185142 RepID=UPI000DF84ACF|nr:DUF2497 domain-containing protein [Altererythrobacter sp. ZODW24]
MQQQGEASVEEILESIKKVIARDNRSDAAQARTRRTIAAEAADSPGSADDTDEVLDLAAAEFVEEAPTNDGSDGECEQGEPLTAAITRGSMRDNFEALAMLSEPGKQPQIVRTGETSLEGMVREMLRPMLATWLDTNLPPLVEKMVAAEIARIAGKRG